MNLSVRYQKKKKTSILISLLLLCGCGTVTGKPAAEDLSLALAGMDGSDAVSFEGSAQLLLGGKPVQEETLYYGGKVEDHSKVSLYTLLPDEEKGTRAASTRGVKTLGQSRKTAPAYYTRLEKKDGEWQMQQATPSTGGTNPLTALNPLHQLEALEGMQKQVTEEAGAARGSRVLRIELSSAEAKRQLTEQLEREMTAIQPDKRTVQQNAAAKQTQASAAMSELWKQKQNELQQKLVEAEVVSVYSLKVDAKRNLPKRLTWTRKITYPASADTSANETYVTEVDFYGYH